MAAATYKIARRTARRSCNERKPPNLILSSQRANSLSRARYESPHRLGHPAACALDGARAPEQRLIPVRRPYHRASLLERSWVRPDLDAGADAPKCQLHDAGVAAECQQYLRLAQWCR